MKVLTTSIFVCICRPFPSYHLPGNLSLTEKKYQKRDNANLKCKNVKIYEAQYTKKKFGPGFSILVTTIFVSLLLDMKSAG